MNSRRAMLHIYSPIWQHADGYIIGDRWALEDLRDALDRAISSKEPTSFNAFVNDGEGYTVHVAWLSEQDVDRLSLPYTDADEMERSNRGIAPHQAIANQMAEAVKPWDDPLL